MHRLTLVASALFITALACTLANPAPPPTPSVFDSGRTAYGFFPSPPEPSILSVITHFVALGKHADFVLVQPNIPWADVGSTAGKEPQRLTDIRNQVNLAYQNGLQVAFVVDPLNGLNRREFLGLPTGWTASFANPDVRAAFKSFALWIARSYHPRYLGLASEINTYADAHPDDFAYYLSLYRETYATIKSASPETQVFATFQWEDLNNLIPQAAEGRTRYRTNWEEVEAFEPQLDLWAISSYPFAVFKSGAEIPVDYYTPLLTRTDKPLAVAEGGYTSRPVGPFPGTPQDQVDYLNAIHTQLGTRLRFWVYLLLSDFNPQSFADAMRKQGLGQGDLDTLGMFSAVGLRQADGTAKPALNVWTDFERGDEPSLRSSPRMTATYLPSSPERLPIHQGAITARLGVVPTRGWYNSDMTTPRTSTQRGGLAASFSRPRRVREVIAPQMVIEGAGVLLRRSFGPSRANRFDPFLLFDHFAFNDPKEGPILGFPTHPHRGIETVTYMLEGNVRHRDSLGNMGVIGPGDVQWMTSGRGILHEEMPHRSPEGKVNGFQLWVNLPAGQKMSQPRYQGVDADYIPAARTPGRTVRVVAGSFDGVVGPVTAITAGPLYADISLEPQAELTVPVAPGETLLAYVFEGAGNFGSSASDVGQRVEAVHMVIFEDGDHLRVRADDASPARFMLIAGAPFGEPIVPYGPFVMNSEEEIQQALADLRNGTFVTS